MARVNPCGKIFGSWLLVVARGGLWWLVCCFRIDHLDIFAQEQHQALEGLHHKITLFVCGRQSNPKQVRLLVCVSVFPMLVVGLLPISKADQFSTIHTGGGSYG